MHFSLFSGNQMTRASAHRVPFIAFVMPRRGKWLFAGIPK
jgi:hypothetical protein